MNTDLPRLNILPIESLLLHEQHDERRTPSLIKRLRTEGVLRNPPIVTPLHDCANRYVVLDGTNRIAALQAMGFPHVLAQVVELDDNGLNLKTWNHVVWGLTSATLLNGIQRISSLDLQCCNEERAFKELESKNALASILLPSGDVYTVYTVAPDTNRYIASLIAIVDGYKDCASMDRTSLSAIEPLTWLYPELSGLVIFQPFEIEEVFRLVMNSYQFPSGITHFTVSLRALRVNYSLSELESDKPLAKKCATLQEWIRARMACKNVRHYEEATVLFDE